MIGDMVWWKPDKNSPKPIYRQIVDYFKGEISSGALPLGSRLPSQREMAAFFDVNRSTVVEALEELKSEGIIEGKGGSGTRVANNTWAMFLSGAKTNWKPYIEKGIHKPNLPMIQAINKLEADPEVLRLGTGEPSPEFFPKEMMEKVMSKVSSKLGYMGYIEPKGMYNLRKVISEHLKTKGISQEPSSILIVSGALQALQLISLGISPLGSTILVENPSYLQSLYVFQSSGMKLESINMDERGLKLDDLKKKVKKSKSQFLYTIPTYQNPTGRLMDLDRRKELVKFCMDERIPIIEDDVYSELWFDEEPPTPLKALDKGGNILYVGSLSKSLAPGFRIGWIAGPEPVIERLADIKMQTDYGSSSISQWIVAEWIESGYYFEHLKNMRRELKERRDIALEILNEKYWTFASWEIPKGGFYIWLKMKKALNLKNLFDETIKRKILLNPGSIYDHDDDQHLRISYSYESKEDLKKGLIILSEIIEDMIIKEKLTT